jgi:hypothetical protein
MSDLVFVHVAVALWNCSAGVENASLQFGGEELGLAVFILLSVACLCLMLRYINMIRRKFILVNASWSPLESTTIKVATPVASSTSQARAHRP